jgi:hypothetical protein
LNADLHARYVDGGNYGQNLAMGSGCSISDSINMWYDEASSFAPYYGEASPGGNFMDYGHFTQLVWKSTTAIGCAQTNCGGGSGGSEAASGNLVVCNYYIAGELLCPFGQVAMDLVLIMLLGNMDGDYANNVLPKSS